MRLAVPGRKLITEMYRRIPAELTTRKRTNFCQASQYTGGLVSIVAITPNMVTYHALYVDKRVTGGNT